MGKSELPEGRSEPGLGKRVANPLSILGAMSMGESGAGVGRTTWASWVHCRRGDGRLVPGAPSAHYGMTWLSQ
jgi:hypothetical protein